MWATDSACQGDIVSGLCPPFCRVISPRNLRHSSWRRCDLSSTLDSRASGPTKPVSRYSSLSWVDPRYRGDMVTIQVGETQPRGWVRWVHPKWFSTLPAKHSSCAYPACVVLPRPLWGNCRQYNLSHCIATDATWNVGKKEIHYNL
jgi:hypothetical protein